MTKRTIQNTKFHSKRIGHLPNGCKQCVKGEKLVLFITGICPRDCWFCPLSDKKMNKDVIYANEWKIEETEDIFREIKLTSAKGTGITGGDPLSKLSRTTDMIKLLKKRMGKDFHIHLYTSLNLVNDKTLKKLYDAGLDEIRFHPDLEDEKLWERMLLATEYDWDCGVEIPVIPGSENSIKKIIEIINGNLKFLNLNELEVTETNADIFREKGLKTINNISQAIKGSKELALKILKYSQDKKIKVHFCTPKLKDSVQLKNRLLRRARNIATDFEMVTDEGLLLKTVIYGDIEKIKKYLKQKRIKHQTDLKGERVQILPEDFEEYHQMIKDDGFKPALVEQYPTYDALDAAVDFI